jgi:N-acylneuraminate cytidylyltransferase
VLASAPATSPFRAPEDLDACIRAVLDGGTDVACVVTPAERNPYYNMVCLDEDGYARVVVDPSAPIVRRQDAPPVYDMTTVAYAARPEFVREAGGLFEGRVRAVVVPRERALDIDTELDLAWAEFRMARSGRAGEPSPA